MAITVRQLKKILEHYNDDFKIGLKVGDDGGAVWLLVLALWGIEDD